MSFELAADSIAEITAAGGNRSLLGAISEKSTARISAPPVQVQPAPKPVAPPPTATPATPPSAAPLPSGPTPRPQSGSRLFIAPMEGNLNGFLATEIVKQKLPVLLVTDEKEAQFILTGAAMPGDNKWYHSIFGGKDKTEGNVQMISVSARQVIWAGEAGDRSLLWGNFRRGGQRKVADRIVSKMKDELF